MGLDVMYSKLDGATTPTGTVTTAFLPALPATGLATTVYRTGDNDVWSFRFRVHRDFYP